MLHFIRRAYVKFQTHIDTDFTTFHCVIFLLRTYQNSKVYHIPQLKQREKELEANLNYTLNPRPGRVRVRPFLQTKTTKNKQTKNYKTETSRVFLKKMGLIHITSLLPC